MSGEKGDDRHSMPDAHNRDEYSGSNLVESSRVEQRRRVLLLRRFSHSAADTVEVRGPFNTSIYQNLLID